MIIEAKRRLDVLPSFGCLGIIDDDKKRLSRAVELGDQFQSVEPKHLPQSGIAVLEKLVMLRPVRTEGHHPGAAGHSRLKRRNQERNKHRLKMHPLGKRKKYLQIGYQLTDLLWNPKKLKNRAAFDASNNNFLNNAMYHW